jgi:hypothetical protein
MRIALIYDSVVRPDTTGGHCLAALQELLGAESEQHFGPRASD